MTVKTMTIDMDAHSLLASLDSLRVSEPLL